MSALTPAMLMMNPKMVVFPPTRPELLRIEYPSDYVQAKLAHLLPLAQAWYQQTEQELYFSGRALNPQEQAIALKLAVQAPEQVRVLVLDEFPLPKQEVLKQAATEFGFGTESELARTIGSVILLKPSASHDPVVLQHELVHISQIERLGRAGFIERYLSELFIVGYARAPLELEAYAKQYLDF